MERRLLTSTRDEPRSKATPLSAAQEFRHQNWSQGEILIGASWTIDAGVCCWTATGVVRGLQPHTISRTHTLEPADTIDSVAPKVKQEVECAFRVWREL